MPTLAQGLIECCKMRPDDPVDFVVSKDPRGVGWGGFWCASEKIVSITILQFKMCAPVAFVSKQYYLQKFRSKSYMIIIMIINMIIIWLWLYFLSWFRLWLALWRRVCSRNISLRWTFHFLISGWYQIVSQTRSIENKSTLEFTEAMLEKPEYQPFLMEASHSPTPSSLPRPLKSLILRLMPEMAQNFDVIVMCRRKHPSSLEKIWTDSWWKTRVWTVSSRSRVKSKAP